MLKKSLGDLRIKVDSISPSILRVIFDIMLVNSGTQRNLWRGRAIKMKFMAKIKCPIWQLLAATHARCHKCGRLASII